MGSKTAPPPPNIKSGDVIGDRFIVKKKLGEGSCGAVWLMESNKNAKAKYALKIEPRFKSKEEEILRMEIYVLKKVQKSNHVARFYGCGATPSYSYVIMSLLGKDLCDCRRKCPGRKIPAGSALRVGIQAIQALEDLHIAGFVHRDVKPANLAVGMRNKKMVYLLDFGLSRQLLIPDKSNKLQLREPRNKVSFRGTVRYCSINVHQFKEQGRHDDLIGLLFTLIEFVTGTLPWKGSTRVVAEQIKLATTDDVLLKGCPGSFKEMYSNIKSLTYKEVPPYAKIREFFAKEIKSLGVEMVAPYEWELVGKDPKDDKLNNDDKDKAEADKNNDTDNSTNKDVDESVASASSENLSNNAGYDEENTLDSCGDVENKISNEKTKEEKN